MYGASAATEEDAKIEEPKPAAEKVEKPVASVASGSDSEEDSKVSGSKKHQLKMA